MQKDRIDVIIPAFKAHGTMFRCLSSIVCQTIVQDLRVTIVNDCCPEGSYKEFVSMFAPYVEIREIRLPENRGPGVARQTGIDESDCEFITFIDADDSLYNATALETLMNGIQESETYKCASAAFYHDNWQKRKKPDDICYAMVWVFGKLYRRSFLNDYNIRFLDSRANEDSGFNHIIKMLCDNPNEQIKWIEEYVYYYRKDNEDSITTIGNGQYFYDQCCCGGIDNMIYAIEHVRKYKPLSGKILEETLGCLMAYYVQYVRIRAQAPGYTVQLWEYIKKFYHTCYKRIEDFISDEIFRWQYSQAMATHTRTGDLMGIIPQIGIREFMHRLQTEKYDPDLIYEIWEEMENDPEFSEAMKNNILCGVCPDGYTERPKEG